jgi:hypothetical protein
MNKLYQSLIHERIRYAIAAARAVQPLEHSGVKGAIREVLIADLFRPLLPADIGVGTGIVISSTGQQSAQQDIIVFDKSILPPILFEQGPAIVPVEAALICIEVKSKLNADQLQKAHKNSKTVLNLRTLSGHRDNMGNFLPSPHPSSVRSMLLALDTDLTEKGKTEIERFKDLLGDQYPIFLGICIVGRGSWWPTENVSYNSITQSFSRKDGLPITGEWRKVSSDANHSEVMDMISGVLNIAQSITKSRGQPPLYSYLT